MYHENRFKLEKKTYRTVPRKISNTMLCGFSTMLVENNPMTHPRNLLINQRATFLPPVNPKTQPKV